MTPRTHVLLGIALAALLAACRTPPPASAATGSSAAAQAVPASAGIDPTILDRGVNPCDDFYRFACGGWIAHFTLPPDKSAYGRSFSVIDDRNLVVLREIAEADAAGKLDPADRYPDKVGAFWTACMDEAGTEQHGLSDLKDAWARIDSIRDPTSLAAELGDLHRMNVTPAFDVGSEQDPTDATRVIGIIAQGGLSLPDRDYYLKTDPASAQIQDTYRAHVTRMLELAGEPAAQAGAEANAVFELEKTIAGSQWSRVQMRDPKLIYHPVDLAGLQKLAPRFDWNAYLKQLGHPGLTTFDVTTPRSLEQLDGLLVQVPLDTWRAYFRWKLLSSMASARALPRAFTDERFAFTSKAFTGAKELELRWKHCVRTTGRMLGEALGQAFVRRTFGAEGKTRSRELITGIEAAMASDLDAIPWMDDPTRRAAHEKLDHVVNKVGYPDRWRNYDSLEVDRTSFFRNLLAANAFEVNRDLAKIGKPVDRTEWGMPPQTVNAYYDPSMNEIVFPAGILQPPFFGRAAPDELNYGAIGMVMGHELTHGFDDQGRQYDALGNLRDWWTPAVSQQFDERAACVADQFDGYTAVGDVKLNGKLTLGENIADLGGIKLSHAAWMASRQGKPSTGMAGFTPEQAFFLAFAQSWCEVVRPELARMYAATDPHSPPQWRVNGPLSNLDAFRKAFSCSEGSPMVRSGAKQCVLW
jgi:endothelin-converting enzyme/putative endopeptidase